MLCVCMFPKETLFDSTVNGETRPDKFTARAGALRISSDKMDRHSCDRESVFLQSTDTGDFRNRDDIATVDEGDVMGDVSAENDGERRRSCSFPVEIFGTFRFSFLDRHLPLTPFL